MSAQLIRLKAKAIELEMMISYARAKIDWLTRGKQGQQPDFWNYARGGSQVNVDETAKPLPTIPPVCTV